MLPEFPAPRDWTWLVVAALREDLGTGDVTSRALIPRERTGAAVLEARSPAILAGLPVAREVFARLAVELHPCAEEGTPLEPGQIIARVQGSARAILAGERTALNFLARLCAIATHTRRFVDALAGTGVAIVDTRKTTPGWRVLEKYAVRCGGGVNHRMGLYDGVMIKDNHIAAVGSLAEAVRRARMMPARPIFVEVESPEAAESALMAGADLLMIDNQPLAVIEKIVALVAGRVPLEVTGGVTLERACRLARSGVNRLSAGALTHNPPPIDVALEWDPGSSS